MKIIKLQNYICSVFKYCFKNPFDRLKQSREYIIKLDKTLSYVIKLFDTGNINTKPKNRFQHQNNKQQHLIDTAIILRIFVNTNITPISQDASI